MAHGSDQSRQRNKRRVSKGFAFDQQRPLYTKRRCPETGKRKFVSQLDVLIEHMQNPRGIRAYKCPHDGCGGWHATSQT